MRYPLDTHAFVWTVGDPTHLSETARTTLNDIRDELLASPVSIWEMSIKHYLGRWPEVAPFMDGALHAQFSRRLGTRELVVRSSHTRLAGQFWFSALSRGLLKR